MNRILVIPPLRLSDHNHRNIEPPNSVYFQSIKSLNDLNPYRYGTIHSNPCTLKVHRKQTGFTMDRRARRCGNGSGLWIEW